MERDLNVIQMETHILEIFREAKRMEKVFTLGVMVKYMMENGIKDLSMAMEYGEDYIMILTLENGGHQKLKDMEFTLGKMEIVMKVNGNNA